MELTDKMFIFDNTFKAVFPLAKVSALMLVTESDTTYLRWLTLGVATYIETILSVSLQPRWPRQILFCVTFADGFACKLHQCKQSIIVVDDQMFSAYKS